MSLQLLIRPLIDWEKKTLRVYFFFYCYYEGP